MCARRWHVCALAEFSTLRAYIHGRDPANVPLYKYREADLARLLWTRSRAACLAMRSEDDAVRQCLLFARAPDDGGVRWTRAQLDWIDAAGIDDRPSGDADDRVRRAQVLAAIVGVVVDQTWGAAVTDRVEEGHEYVLAVAWGDAPYASLGPDELELLAARWLHEEGWRPEHGGDAALAAMQRAEQRHARDAET